MFCESGQRLNDNDVIKLITQRDKSDRTPIDLACYLNFKNVTTFLMSKLGADFVI